MAKLLSALVGVSMFGAVGAASATGVTMLDDSQLDKVAGGAIGIAASTGANLGASAATTNCFTTCQVQSLSGVLGTDPSVTIIGAGILNPTTAAGVGVK